MIDRREFLALLSAVAAAPSFGAVSGRPKPKAVVLFYVDDLGYADTSTYGQKRVPCPNLDKLAAEGCKHLLAKELFTHIDAELKKLVGKLYALL